MSSNQQRRRVKLTKDDMRFFAVGSDKAVYANGSVLDSPWRKITKGEVTDVMVWQGVVYGLGKNNDILRWDKNRWIPTRVSVPQSMTNLMVRKAGVYGLKDGKVWVSPFHGRQDWLAITPPNVQGFTIIGRSTIYAVGMDKCVYRINIAPGQKWQKVTGGAVTQVDVVDDIIYGLGTRGGIYKYEGGWVKIISGPMTSFAVAGKYIYGVGKDNKIYKCSNDWIKTTERFSSPLSLKAGTFSRL